MRKYSIILGITAIIGISQIPFLNKTNYIYKGNVFDAKQVGNYMHFIIEQQKDFYQDSINVIYNPIMKNLEIGDSLTISMNRKQSAAGLLLEEITNIETEAFQTQEKSKIEIIKKYPVLEDLKRI